MVENKATGVKPEDLLSSFRDSSHRRVVVTLDAMATGADIEPPETVVSLRQAERRNFYE